MKVAQRVLDVQSTLEGEKIGMSIDQGALSHIMSVLTDLYSDPEQAVIREYSTNALDSHVEAGVTRPIEVQIPTGLSPFFKVRDFGIGLDAEGIREIYSRYGASTKRGSNDVVGMLGLGCKSALTYTDQFTLSGIKDGICTQVSISRDEDGAGSMTIVAEYETDAPNGVEVIVPAKHGNSFESKALDFFRFWKEGTVLVDGKAPKRIDGMWITDDLLLTSDLDGPVVVMGNVAYPVPDPYGVTIGSVYQPGRGYGPSSSLVAFVDIGEVHFTPSREALQMTTVTKETLNEIKQREATERQRALQEIIESAETRSEALLKFYEARGSFGYKGDATYRGLVIPEKFVPAKDKMAHFVVVDAQPRYRNKGWGEAHEIRTNSLDNIYFVVGYDSNAFTPYKRAKLNQWAEKKGHNKDWNTSTRLVFTDKLTQDAKDWFPSDRIFQWAEIDAEKIVREKVATTRDGRPTGSYNVLTAPDTDPWGVRKYRYRSSDPSISEGVEADKLNKTSLYYYHGSARHAAYDQTCIALLSADSTAQIVCLGENRIEKFKRDFPEAKLARAAIEQMMKKWAEKIPAGDKYLLAIRNDSHCDTLAKMDESKVDDPKLSKAIRDAKKAISNEVSTLRNKVQFNARWVQVKLPAFNSPLNDYPLLTDRYGSVNVRHDHTYLYVNAAYAARKEV